MMIRYAVFQKQKSPRTRFHLAASSSTAQLKLPSDQSPTPSLFFLPFLIPTLSAKPLFPANLSLTSHIPSSSHPLQRQQIPHRQAPRNNWRNQPQPIPTRPLPRHILRLIHLLLTRALRQRLELIIQRLHIQRRVQDSRKMHNSREPKKLPVAARQHALAIHGHTRVRVPQEPERRDGPEELVANGPAEGPLAAEEFSSRFVRGRAWWWEVDKEGGDSHVGLGYRVAWIVVNRGVTYSTAPVV
jgi:hypothetical protein